MTGTLTEHAETIKAAIKAAREDGYYLQWDFLYVDWWGEREVSTVTVDLVTHRRVDGIMRITERANVLEEDV